MNGPQTVSNFLGAVYVMGERYEHLSEDHRNEIIATFPGSDFKKGLVPHFSITWSSHFHSNDLLSR